MIAVSVCSFSTTSVRFTVAVIPKDQSNATTTTFFALSVVSWNNIIHY